MYLITQVSVLKNVRVCSAVASSGLIGACHLHINWVLCRNLESYLEWLSRERRLCPEADAKTNIFSTTIMIIAETFCREISKSD